MPVRLWLGRGRLPVHQTMWSSRSAMTRIATSSRTGWYPYVVTAEYHFSFSLWTRQWPARLERDGIPVVRAPCERRIQEIWAIRAQAIHAMVAGGLNVTHSDVDAVWIKNPMGLLGEIEADIVSSQGSVHPRECHAQWGHVLCYGFIQLRASEATVELLGEAAAAASREPQFDDQCFLNNQLLARGIEWSVRSPYRIPFRDTSFTCSREPIVGECLCGQQKYASRRSSSRARATAA